MSEVKIAQLSDEDLEAVRLLEKKLNNRVCLVAVEKETVYVLEAKLGPNVWQRADEVYPIENLRVFYKNEEDAIAAKAGLKSLLNSKQFKDKVKKRPLRVRCIE